jgi:hypothetical protein
MHGFDPIQITAMALAALVVLVMAVALFRSWRNSASSRRREDRLSSAFDRARYVRRHGSIPVGSQYGIYENRARSIGAMR